MIGQIKEWTRRIRRNKQPKDPLIEENGTDHDVWVAYPGAESEFVLLGQSSNSRNFYTTLNGDTYVSALVFKRSINADYEMKLQTKPKEDEPEDPISLKERRRYPVPEGVVRVLLPEWADTNRLLAYDEFMQIKLTESLSNGGSLQTVVSMLYSKIFPQPENGSGQAQPPEEKNKLAYLAILHSPQ